MKKNWCFLAVIAVFFASCASVPTELYDSVSALRLRTTRFSPVATYAEQDFADGEANYNEASQLISTKKELKRTPELLTAAQSAYTRVIEIGMPAYAADLGKTIDALIEEAVAVKANAGLKAQFDMLSANYEAAKTLADAKDYDNALEKLEAVKKEAENLIALAKEQYGSSLAEVEVVKQKKAQLEDLARRIEQLAQTKGE